MADRPEIQDRARTTKKVSARLAREHARKSYSVPERPFPGLAKVNTTGEEDLPHGVGGAPHMEDVGVDETPGTGPGEGGVPQVEPAKPDPDDASPSPEYFRKTDPRFSDNVEQQRESSKVTSQWPLTEEEETQPTEGGKDFNEGFGTYDPKDYTVDEVKAYVKDHPSEAARLLALEEGEGGKNRQGLSHWLEEQGE